jgi:hypothetical protein
MAVGWIDQDGNETKRREGAPQDRKNALGPKGVGIGNARL